MYTYRDFANGGIKRTRGQFVGWTAPTGLLNVPYAIFANRCSDVLVPLHCVTPETMDRIGKPETAPPSVTDYGASESEEQ